MNFCSFIDILMRSATMRSSTTHLLKSLNKLQIYN